MGARKIYEHLDASESTYFSQQLAVVKAGSYDVKYPNLKGRTFVPPDPVVDEGAQVIVYHQFDQVGLAKIIASYADDLPRADVKGKEFVASIKSLGASYGYNIQEIRASRRAGIPLETRKANAARRAVEEKIDAIIAKGDTANGLVGLLNQPNALLYTVPNGAGASPLWANKTPAEILADLSNVAMYIVTQTKETEVPDTIILPTASYGYVANTTLGYGVSTTILSQFLATNPYIKNVESWAQLAGAGSGGTNRLVCYRRDPDALQVAIPVEFEQFDAEPRGLEFVVPCHARIGGVLLYYPLSMAYADGF
jgi:hypothetical protein